VGSRLSLSACVKRVSAWLPSKKIKPKKKKSEKIKGIHVQIYKDSSPPYVPSTGAVESSLEQRPLPAGRLISQFENKITNGQEKKKKEGRP
jgi:hypothetical protein